MNDQMSVNFHWLLAKMDAAHEELCPGMLGTWQQRAEQLVKAAKSPRCKCGNVATRRALCDTCDRKDALGS